MHAHRCNPAWTRQNASRPLLVKSSGGPAVCDKRSAGLPNSIRFVLFLRPADSTEPSPMNPKGMIIFDMLTTSRTMRASPGITRSKTRSVLPRRLCPILRMEYADHVDRTRRSPRHDGERRSREPASGSPGSSSTLAQAVQRNRGGIETGVVLHGPIAARMQNSRAEPASPGPENETARLRSVKLRAKG